MDAVAASRTFDFKGRREAAFAHFGGVERDAPAGGFHFVQPFPVRRQKRPADKGERNLIRRRGPAAAAKKSRPNEIAPRLRQTRAEERLGAESSKRFASRRNAHFLPQHFRRWGAAAQGQKKSSQPLQFGAKICPAAPSARWRAG